MTTTATRPDRTAPAPPAVRPEPRPADSGGVAARSLLVAVSAALVGATSYLCTLVLAHLLPPSEFSAYAAGQALLTIVGVAAEALVPLPLVAVLRNHLPGSDAHRRGTAFAWMVAAIAGVIAAAAVGLVTSTFASPAVVAAAAASALALFAVSVLWGLLQGRLQFGRYAALSVAEVVVRLGTSVAAGLLGWGAAGAIAGFAVGGLAVFLLFVVPIVRSLSWAPAALGERDRWTETGGIAATQLALTTFTGLDVVVVAMLGHGTAAEAGYQAVSTLAKGPVFLATGTVLVAFPLLRTVGADTGAIIADVLRSFARLALPITVLGATVPPALVGLVLPAEYAPSAALLPWLATTAACFGAITMLGVLLLAVRAYRRTVGGLVLTGVLLAIGTTVGFRLGDVSGLAVGTALAAAAATVALWIVAAPMLPHGTTVRAAGLVLGSGAVVALLLPLSSSVPLWSAAVAVLAAGALLALRARDRRRPPADDADVTVPIRVVPRPKVPLA